MPADSPPPSPDSSNWIDLEAALEEELACIKSGFVPADLQKASEAQSAERAAGNRASIPNGKFFSKLHDNELWGLCLSGGGIRSATFALGILQGLAVVKLLPRFHYLSTVSGGGYIGSWLSSWASRHPRGIDGVVDDLNKAADGKKIEADPLWYLRSYTSYLNPKLGLFSADTWTLVSTYLRNLLLNWLVLVPLFWALVMTPKIGLSLARMLPNDIVTGFLFQHRLLAAQGALVLGCLGLLIGMTYIFAALAEKLSGAVTMRAGPGGPVKVKTQGQFIVFCLVPIMFAALMLPLAWAWYPPTALPHGLMWEIPLVGVVLRFLASTFSFGLAWMRGRLESRQWSPPPGIAVASLATGALGGLLVWWIVTTFFPDIALSVGRPAGEQQYADAIDVAAYVCFAPPLLLLAMLATEGIFIGLVSRYTDDEDREWWGRAGGWLLIGSIFWTGLRVLAVFGPLALHWLEAQAPVLVPALGGISGVATALLGFSSGTPATSGKRKPKTLGDILRGSALVISAAVFVCALFAGLALTGDWILHYVTTGGASADLDCTDTVLAIWLRYCGQPAAALAQSVGLVPVLAFIAALLALALLMQFFVSVNKFSLHAMYRARLIRAYLGASNTRRKPNWFTGFDAADNLNMADIKAGGSKAARQSEEGGSPPPRYPFHILNTALNLVHGEELAWQQRKAASMTVTPLHAGNRDLGYRRSKAYGHASGISLGTALTISGAAASPNMGYHSSPIVGLVMTLFNVRLGAWLGNPGQPAGNNTYKLEGPRLSADSLVYEALGLTDAKKPYVYLTDGGHFENLGLYELCQRRCRLIVVSDAGCDPGFEFEDLGNAIRKIRIDLGVEIEMDKIEMHARGAVDEGGIETVEPGRYFTTGIIRYPEGGEGKLVYLKPGIYGSEPRDVTNYAATHPDFPHESTADQWFDESQYESYRRLGRHVAKRLFGDLDENATIDEIFAVAAPPSQAAMAVPPKNGGGDSTLSLVEKVTTDPKKNIVSVEERVTEGRSAGPLRPGDSVPAAMPKIIHRRPPKPWFGRRR